MSVDAILTYKYNDPKHDACVSPRASGIFTMMGLIWTINSL